MTGPRTYEGRRLVHSSWWADVQTSRHTDDYPMDTLPGAAELVGSAFNSNITSRPSPPTSLPMLMCLTLRSGFTLWMDCEWLITKSCIHNNNVKTIVARQIISLGYKTILSWNNSLNYQVIFKRFSTFYETFYFFHKFLVNNQVSLRQSFITVDFWMWIIVIRYNLE